MLNDYQISAIGQIWPVLIVPLASTVLYWYLSTATNTTRRLLASAHGALLLIAFVYAVAVSPMTGYENWKAWIWPFWILLALFLVAILYTITRYEGNRWIHMFQLLVLPSGFLIWLVGTMTITHDWL
jgi:cell division protein FtsW (lipid II flippase)